MYYYSFVAEDKDRQHVFINFYVKYKEGESLPCSFSKGRVGYRDKDG